MSETQIGSLLAEAEAVRASYDAPEKPARPNGGNGPPPPADDPTRRTHVEAALAEEAKLLATAGRGSRNDRLSTAALKLDRLVAGAWLDRGRVERALEDAAQACDLTRDDGLKSVRATIASGLGAGMREPRDPPERQRSCNHRSGPAPRPESPPEQKTRPPRRREALAQPRCSAPTSPS